MRILVVDDSAAMTEFMRFALRGLPELQLAAANDGVKALQMLVQDAYDVVLLDLNLPLMDGMKVLSAIRDKVGTGAMPAVVIVTSDSREKTRQQAIDLGAVQVLHKPVQAHEVRASIRDALGMPALGGGHDPDKRQASRLTIPVTIRVDGWPPLELVSHDINAYGAFLVSGEVRPVGSKARATLELAHIGKVFEVDCEVMHVRSAPGDDAPCGFGVRFNHASSADLELLLEAFSSPVD